MTLPHAIYGSATGLGDYRILASTASLDDRLRSTIIYYANLEGSARSTPFAPIFSFYSLGEGLWAFSRTVSRARWTRWHSWRHSSSVARG